MEMEAVIDWTILESLSNLQAVSGQEEVIRHYVSQQLPFCQVRADRLGSGLYTLGKSGLSILFSTHMDEVGHMVSRIDEHGYLFIQSVGGTWTHTLLQQLVTITTQSGKTYQGIIAGPQIHALSKKARESVLPMSQAFIDLGVESRAEVEKLGIQVGDRVCPYAIYQPLNNPNYLLGKAFDNRVSVALGIWLMQSLQEQSSPNQVTLATTVQEEVGLRGARTVAHMIEPQIAFAVDTCLAGDTPADKNPIKLGKGVTLNAVDNMTLTNRGLLIYLEKLCQKHQIPYQIACFMDGGTDAGNIYKSLDGILATTLSIPLRYMHTHQGILHKKDVEATLRLMKVLCQELTPEIYEQIMTENYRFQKGEGQCGE